MPLLPNRANSKNNNEGMGDMTPIPAGDYIAHITKSEIKDTKAGDGKRLNLQFVVLDGKHKGRVIFVGLNIANPNPQAVGISMKELNSICQACGVSNVEESEELHQIPMGIRVGVTAGSEQYPPRNEIKAYSEISSKSSKKPKKEKEEKKGKKGKKSKKGTRPAFLD